MFFIVWNEHKSSIFLIYLCFWWCSFAELRSLLSLSDEMESVSELRHLTHKDDVCFGKLKWRTKLMGILLFSFSLFLFSLFWTKNARREYMHMHIRIKNTGIRILFLMPCPYCRQKWNAFVPTNKRGNIKNLIVRLQLLKVHIAGVGFLTLLIKILNIFIICPHFLNPSHTHA